MKSLIVFTAIAFATMGYSADTSAKTATKAQGAAGQKIEFHDEVDKTDVLAVPFDTSEEEEAQEEKTLQNLQTYEQNKKLQEQKQAQAKTK